MQGGVVESDGDTDSGCKKLKERLLFHEFEKMTKCGYHQVGSYFIQHIPYASYYSTRPFA